MVWDSGRVETAATMLVVPEGIVNSRTRYAWELELGGDEVAGPHAGGSAWFEAGLIDPDHRRGNWIHRVVDGDRAIDPPSFSTPSLATRRLSPAPHFRKVFTVTRPVRRARLYSTARGLYRPYLNGARVGDCELAPGWTDYNDRVLYQTFDVTAQVTEGDNVLGIVLSDGWWSGFVGSDRREQGYHWGRYPQAWAQLVIDHDGDAVEWVTTGEGWRYADGEIRYSDLLMGEFVDARQNLGDWTTAGYDDSWWTPAVVGPDSLQTLAAMPDDPIRAVEHLNAISVEPGSQGYIVDFGQNISGRIRVRIDEPAGTVVRFRYAEILDDGELYLENLRTAEATDWFISAGVPYEFEPAFASHGFRYLEINGTRTAPDPTDVTALVLRNDIPWAGTLETSSAELNQLEQNIRWGQRDNFVAVPTDCPQRDERLGWTADVQVFLPTAAYNADVLAFMERWMRDVRYAQTSEGSFPDVAPKITILTEGAPAWGDAGVIIPWHLYRVYGDRRILEESWESMQRWTSFLEANNPDLIWRRRVGNNYGDWLQLDVETPRDLIATAYFAHSTSLVAQAAAVLGRDAETIRYTRLAERIRAAFRAEFVQSDGRLKGDTQTAYLLALRFHLVPELQQQLAAHLVRTIEERGVSLTTGFVGVPLLCPVLSDIGRTDLAYALLERDEYPSWLYSVRQGATTIWERWDGWTEERGFQAAKMNSFNHYCLGSVGEWLYEYAAGIGQDAGSAGFSGLRIAPRVGGTLTSVTASYETPRGRVSSAWSRVGEEITVSVEVPPGMPATVVLPFQPAGALAGDQELTASGLRILRSGESSVEVSVEPGQYRFRGRRVSS
ncbi:MAG: family 78 glycoside hydrolase catalytic domain [Propionicimonas sp.]